MKTKYAVPDGKKVVKFSQLSIGAHFRFLSEYAPVGQRTHFGEAVKRSGRTYRYVEGKLGNLSVGSVNVECVI